MGSLNLCLREPESMQKESVQSDHTARRKRPKCAQKLRYFDVGPKLKIGPYFGRFLGAG